MSYSGKPALRGGKPCKLCDTKGVVALEKGTKLEICVLCNGMGAFDSSRNPTTAYGTQYDKSCHNCNGRCFLRIKLKEQRQKKYSMAEVECKACKGMGKFDGTWATPSRNGQVNCVPCGATGKVSIEEGETLEKCIKCNGQGGENSVGAPTKYHYGYCYDHAWYTAPCWNCNGRCFAVGSSSPQKFPAANVECPLCQGGEDRKGCPSCRDTRKVCLKYGERLSPCIICQGKGGFWMGGPSSFFSGWKQEDCNGCKGRGYDRVGGSVVDGASDSD